MPYAVIPVATPVYLPSSSAVNTTVKATNKCERSAAAISATAIATRCSILFTATSHEEMSVDLRSISSSSRATSMEVLLPSSQ